MTLDDLAQLATRIRTAVARVVVGHQAVVEGLLVALLAEGHALLEGPPGTAKTLLARTFSTLLGLDFRRVQFTPDLLPSDLVGTNLFDFESNRFHLSRGPVFTEVLLADEINRTPPKTQAALLEAMQEHQVTLDGTTHRLSDCFLVVATQNPIEQEGTYPLPEAQLDRFLLKMTLGFAGREDEIEAVRLHGHRATSPRAERLEALGVVPVTSREEIRAARRLVGEIHLSDEMLGYVVDLVRSTREHPSIAHGASTRAASMLAVAGRAAAALDGRDFVLPDDVKRLAPRVLGHRLVIDPAAEVEGLETADLVDRIVRSVPAPR